MFPKVPPGNPVLKLLPPAVTPVIRTAKLPVQVQLRMNLDQIAIRLKEMTGMNLLNLAIAGDVL